jgi:hypothetical protein
LAELWNVGSEFGREHNADYLNLSRPDGVRLTVDTWTAPDSKGVLGGIGARAMGDQALDREDIAKGLVADGAKSIADRTARQFRRFADSTGADRLALAAIMRSPWKPIANPGNVAVPCLVEVGPNDDLAVNAQALTDAIPGARLVVTDGDHLGAIGVPEYADEIVTFLNEIGASSEQFVCVAF